jgi:hypothetical protein
MTKPKSLILHPHEPRGLLSGEIRWVSRPFPKEYQPDEMRKQCPEMPSQPCEVAPYMTGHPEKGLAYYWRGSGGAWNSSKPFFPPWKVGDVLAGKETWKPHISHHCVMDTCDCDDLWIEYRNECGEGLYVRSGERPGCAPGDWEMPKTASWQSPATMPTWAVRIHLRVLEVQAQRCCDVSNEDAIAEGMDGRYIGTDMRRSDRYGNLPKAQLKALWLPYYRRRGIDWDSAWRWRAKVEVVKS